jgi:hypothetical protein
MNNESLESANCSRCGKQLLVKTAKGGNFPGYHICIAVTFLFVSVDQDFAQLEIMRTRRTSVLFEPNVQAVLCLQGWLLLGRSQDG